MRACAKLVLLLSLMAALVASASAMSLRLSGRASSGRRPLRLTAIASFTAGREYHSGHSARPHRIHKKHKKAKPTADKNAPSGTSGTGQPSGNKGE